VSYGNSDNCAATVALGIDADGAAGVEDGSAVLAGVVAGDLAPHNRP
jgi:hypothetical protein